MKSMIFKCPRCRRMHSVPYMADLREFICPNDVFVRANKPKAQNILQKFSDLSRADGTIEPQWFLQRLDTLRDAHLEAPIVNPQVLPKMNRHTGLTRGAYKY